LVWVVAGAPVEEDVAVDVDGGVDVDVGGVCARWLALVAVGVRRSK
jgi:hypothetical protein